MADIFINVNLEPGPGVDARLFFPGATSAQIVAPVIDGNDGLYYYSSLTTGKQYEIEYSGTNFQFSTVGTDLEGEITGATLYEFDGNGNKFELGTMSITDQDGNPASIEMTSAANFTQNSPQNAMPGKTVQLSQTGDSGADKIYGGAYSDILSGYGGHDTLTGGDGNDQFEFISGGTSTYDYLTDFTHGHDKLVLDTDLRNFGSNIHNNNLASVFHDITNSPEKASDRLVYNHNNGHLSYDPDGSGSKPAQLIAVLTNHATVTYSDFHVV